MYIKQIALEVREDGQVFFEGRLCVEGRHKAGYQQVRLPLHRLIAHAFHGPPPTPKHVCHHRDSNPRNNCADNLEWLTRAENSRQAASGPRKLSPHEVEEIRALKPEAGIELTQLAKSFGISYMGAQAIRNGRNWPNGWYPGGHGRSTITKAQYDAIKAWAPPSITSNQVARRYHVSAGTVLNIWNGHS